MNVWSAALAVKGRTRMSAATGRTGAMTYDAPSTGQVLVYGATGHTGRAVVAALSERGMSPVLAARDAVRLGELTDALGLEGRAFPVDDVPDLSGVDLVLNCAGPFADTALPLARAAVAAGAHYLDIAAEQPSTLALLHSLSAAAAAAGVVVMPGVAFFGGLGDLLVSALPAPGDGGPWERVAIEIELSGWHPSDATLATGERNPGARLRLSEGLLVTTDVEAPTPDDRVELRLSEHILLSRHLPVLTLHTTVNASAIDDLESARDLTSAQRSLAREEQGDTFRMHAVVRRGDEQRSATIEGDDFYAVSGPLAVEVAVEVLAGRFAPGGRAPGEVPDPAALLRRLPLSGLELPS